MDLRKVLCSVLTVGLSTICSVSYADYKNQSEFGNNGSIAQVLEDSINKFMMPLEVQQIGNAVYNVGIVYGALGQEITSSNPQYDFVSKHQSGYCSPNISVEKDGFQCVSQSGNLNNDATSAQFLEMGDIRTSVLLEPIVYTDVLSYAAQNYIRNITLPFPSASFANYISNPSTFSKNSTQRTAYANFMANQALLSVARYALDEMYSMRVSGTTMGASGNAASNQSILSIMETESSRRFSDPNYVAFLKDPTTLQVDFLREIAAMQAFDLWMQYQNYRQNERIAALLAASLSLNASGAISGNIAQADMSN